MFLDAAGAVLHGLTAENWDQDATSPTLFGNWFAIFFIYLEEKSLGLFCSHFTFPVPIYTGFISSKAVTLLFLLYISIVFTAAVSGSTVVSTMQMTGCWMVANLEAKKDAGNPQFESQINHLFPVAFGKSLDLP